jgi:hypothetical protein
MEAMRNIEEAYAEWKQKVLDEGRRGGRGEGRIEAIEALCSVLGIELTEERRQALASWDTAQLEAHLTELITTRRWPGE